MNYYAGRLICFKRKLTRKLKTKTKKTSLLHHEVKYISKIRSEGLQYMKKIK